MVTTEEEEEETSRERGWGISVRFIGLSK